MDGRGRAKGGHGGASPTPAAPARVAAPPYVDDDDDTRMSRADDDERTLGAARRRAAREGCRIGSRRRTTVARPPNADGHAVDPPQPIYNFVAARHGMQLGVAAVPQSLPLTGARQTGKWNFPRPLPDKVRKNGPHPALGVALKSSTHDNFPPPRSRPRWHPYRFDGLELARRGPYSRDAAYLSTEHDLVTSTAFKAASSP